MPRTTDTPGGRAGTSGPGGTDRGRGAAPGGNDGRAVVRATSDPADPGDPGGPGGPAGDPAPSARAAPVPSPGSSAPSSTAGQPASAGPEAERRQLMDSALKVMRRNGFLGASVQDILDDAGLSTRAFYRQFQSKDDLLLAMFRTAAGPDVEHLARQVGTAASPLEAVRTWVGELLDIAFDRRRVQRLVIFNASARQTVGYDDECAWLEDHLVAPLAEALRRGVEDGSLPDADPLPDAHTMFELVWSVASPLVRQRRPIERNDAFEHVLRFSLPALGAGRS